MNAQSGRSHIPSVLNHTPRRVKTIGAGNVIMIWVVRLAFTPFMLVGLYLLAGAILGPFWVLNGVNHIATVVDLQSAGSGKQAKFYVTAEYTLDDQKRRLEDTVPEREFNRIIGPANVMAVERPAYQTVFVRAWGQPPLVIERFMEPDETPWNQYFAIAIMCLIWNAILLGIYRAMFLKPWQTKRLYRRGQASPCVITGKDVTTRKGTNSYWVYYDFQLNGQPHSATMEVRDKDAYDSILIGQPATVLHWPGKAKPSAVYEFGYFRCE
jgi:hypothetical protein